MKATKEMDSTIALQPFIYEVYRAVTRTGSLIITGLSGSAFYLRQQVLTTIRPLMTTVTALLLLLCACSSPKEAYMDDLADFVDQVEEKQDELSDEDWEKLDKAFEQQTNQALDKVKTQLTDEDKKEIGRLHGRYLVVRTKAAGQQLIDHLKDGLKYMEGLKDGIQEATDNNDY
jgi:hypothetical protein